MALLLEKLQKLTPHQDITAGNVAKVVMILTVDVEGDGHVLGALQYDVK
jgi:hypothetical protein